jgi:hypothetical protein
MKQPQSDKEEQRCHFKLSPKMIAEPQRTLLQVTTKPQSRQDKLPTQSPDGSSRQSHQVAGHFEEKRPRTTQAALIAASALAHTVHLTISQPILNQMQQKKAREKDENKPHNQKQTAIGTDGERVNCDPKRVLFHAQQLHERSIAHCCHHTAENKKNGSPTASSRPLQSVATSRT